MTTHLRIAMRSFADFEAALAGQLTAFRQDTPEIKVDAVAFDLKTLEDCVLGAEGMRSGSWDLAIFPTDWIGSAAETGAIEDLGPWMEAKPLPDWPEGWPSSLREPLRQHGRFFCIPWHDGPECLIYRKDIFDDPGEKEAFAQQFGRPLAPPVTWEEFRQTARFFTRKSPDRYGTLFAAYPDGHNTLYDLILQVWSRGGELYTPEGTPSLATEKTIEALDDYREIIGDEKACYPGAQQIDSIQSGSVFLSGQIAMMVNWFGFAARSDRAGSPLHGKLALAPVPGGKAGQTASLSNYWVIAMGAGGGNKQESYDLLRHIAAPAMDKLTSLAGAVGVRLSTWNDAEVRAGVPLYSQLASLSAAARTLPFCTDLPRLAEIINQVTIDALSTSEASASILERAQERAMAQKLRLI